jgi:hypothetical protein
MVSRGTNLDQTRLMKKYKRANVSKIAQISPWSNRDNPSDQLNNPTVLPILLRDNCVLRAYLILRGRFRT